MTAVVLTVLLLAEGVTILLLGALLGEHMFIGLMLLGPVALKLASTGYRFVRYYAGSRAYRENGAPPLILRLLAPGLVVATLAVFATGVLLLLAGHRSDSLLLAHKAAFFVWGACFGVHFLWHLPQTARVLGGTSRHYRLPGSGARAALLGAALAGGLVLALALLSLIQAWHRGPSG
jgi:hypothetical protein